MKKYSKKLLGVLLVSAMAATGITAVPGTNVYAAETQEAAEKPVVESVKIDKQGQTLYFDEFDGSDERGFKISVKVSNCTDRHIWVGVNSKNYSDLTGAEYNASTGTYDLTVSNIGMFDGNYFGSDTGKYWISKIAFGDTPDETAEVELSKGSNKYEAKNADEALYWVNISDQYKMTFYEPDLSVKEIRNDSDYKHKIFKQTKTAYVKEGTTEADLKNVYTPSEKAGLTFKGWYAPYASSLFTTLKEDGSFKSGATIVPQYDKKVVPFSVMFTEPDSKGNYGEVVDIQKVNSTSDVKFPTVKGYESYKWQGYADEMGTDYCIKVNGKKPETALSLVSSGVIGSPADGARSGLYHDGSEWNYYKEGIKDTSYTGLCKYNGSWWYVKNGKVDFSTTTLCKYNGAWFYVKGGKVDFSATTLCKYNGSWFYVKNGKVDFGATTLCKYNGTWWYVRNGKVDFNTTGLCKYNGSWFYVSGGKVNFGATGLCKYNGAWWYVRNGKVDFNITTLCKYNGTWWYVRNGKIDFNTTTLCRYNGTWFYVSGGKVNFGATGLVKYNGAWWYVKNGSVSFTTTLCNYNGAWWYINNGVVDFNTTTLVKYGSNWYAVASGKVAWGYTGSINYNGSTYRVVNGVVTF